jgi:hypothetical protein
MSPFNGTIEDEAVVLRLCLDRHLFGASWLCRSATEVPGEVSAYFLRGKLKGLSEETLADFLAKNGESHPVEPDLALGEGFHCLSDEEIERVYVPFGTGGWDGIVTFSRVGFNADITQALGYTAQWLGPLAGDGMYWLCARSGDGWEVQQSTLAWVS